MNGRELGCYVVSEAMNKTFLKNHFGNDAGNLYEADFRDVNQMLKQANGPPGDQAVGAGTVALRSGRPIRPKGRQTVPPRDAIELHLPGGGGYGDPRTRDPHAVRDDVLDGLITAQEAQRTWV